MDVAEFLQAAHLAMRRRCVGGQLGELGRDGFALVSGGLVVARLPRDNFGEAIDWGMKRLRNPLCSAAIYALRVEPVTTPGAPFDALVGGMYFERGAARALRPFMMEWQAPGRLGWFEWAGEGTTADMGGVVERFTATVLAELGQGRGGVIIAGDAEAEQAAYVVCSRAADDPGAFSDNLTGTCCACGEPVIFRPECPKRPPRLCFQCAAEMASPQ